MINRRESELALFEQAAAQGCHVLFSSGASPFPGGSLERMGGFLERNNEDGRRVSALCHTRPSGAMFGLAQRTPFQNDAWTELMSLPSIEERVAQLKEADFKARLIQRSKETGFGVKPELMHAMGWGETPDYDLGRQRNLLQIAEAEGRDPVDVYVDRLIESEGKELWNYWMFGHMLEDQWAYMNLPQVIPMLADTGAHVGIFTDTDSPTFLLSELTRRQGVYSLPEAIRRITQASADVLGLKERGSLKEGWIADLNVFDYDNLETGYPYYANDFPHNGGRFIVESFGYVATLVSGQVIVENGKHTGQRPGTVIRDFVRG